jgi:hypothetical protein
MVDDYSFFGSTVDFVIKNEHLGVLTDLAFFKRQRRVVCFCAFNAGVKEKNTKTNSL